MATRQGCDKWSYKANHFSSVYSTDKTQAARDLVPSNLQNLIIFELTFFRITVRIKFRNFASFAF